MKCGHCQSGSHSRQDTGRRSIKGVAVLLGCPVWIWFLKDDILDKSFVYLDGLSDMHDEGYGHEP